MNSKNTVTNVRCENSIDPIDAQECAAKLGITINEIKPNAYTLFFASDGVSLLNPKGRCDIKVDFVAGALAHRRLYGGGKGQMIAKAVGVTSKVKPSVFDATAGLGRDAFVLATLGCTVTMMERSPISYYLLKDGLQRGLECSLEHERELHEILSRMSLMAGDSTEYLQNARETIADVIYLDPMFPSRQKKAAVKKDMQAFHEVVGKDEDGDDLFACANGKAQHRLVVKRPRLAPNLAEQAPNYRLEGKSSRFDIYTYKSFTR